MNLNIQLLELLVYGLSFFGAGAGLAVIFSVALALLRKQDRLLDQRFEEKHNQFLERKKRVDKALRKS